MSIRQNNKTLILASVIGLSSIGLSSISNAQAQSETIDSRFTMTGYGDVTYFDQEDGNSVFRSRFIPIFLYKLNDKIHIESEIEFGIGEEGETEATMEYADLHYFLTDNTTLTAGKFLLPFGQFGPNLHPSWINRHRDISTGIFSGKESIYNNACWSSNESSFCVDRVAGSGSQYCNRARREERWSVLQ